MVIHPAQAAQPDPALQKGDLLVEVNDKTVKSLKQVEKLLNTIQPDSVITMEVFRPKLNKSLKIFIIVGRSDQRVIVFLKGVDWLLTLNGKFPIISSRKSES